MRRPQERGFTLIELLVSLGLLAVAATLLMSSLTMARSVERRAEAFAAATESVAAAQGLLRDRMEMMLPETYFLGVEAVTDVRGGAEIFSFTATPPDSQRPSPPRRYRLALTRAGELSLFDTTLLATRPDPMAPSVAGWNRAPLLGNVARLQIGYFGIAPPDNQRRWRARWEQRPNLPELVRVRVSFPPGDPRIWPELLVRPAASVNAWCIIDSVTGRCRTGAR